MDKIISMVDGQTSSVLDRYITNSHASPALCVDLDGTLVKSDTLYDTALSFAHHHPQQLLRFPGWLSGGKAAFKRHLASSFELDVVHLPYNRKLIEFLAQERAEGRAIYLATASDAVTARRIADHLGIFSDVLASDGVVNLAGQNKLAAFRQRFGDHFCYIGNSTADIPLLTCCVEPMVANPTRGLCSALGGTGIDPARTFEDREPFAKSLFRALRLARWSKNALIFLPLLLERVWHPVLLAAAALAFLAFGLCASATYVVNDLLDIEADRQHPIKRSRPFAAGDLSVFAGMAMVAFLFAASLAMALLLPYRFAEALVIYAVISLAYSLWLKRFALASVVVIAVLYTIRIFAGAAAAGIPVPIWLAVFSLLFFLSVASVKRYLLRRRT